MAKKAGRPPKYNSEIHDNLVYQLARDNKTNEEIADKYLHIATSTFYEWLKTHQTFSEAHKEGYEAKNNKVEKNIYVCADWHEVKERTEIYKVDENGNRKGDTEVKEITKWLPPNIGAIMAILKTQRRNKWAESYIIDDSGCQNLKALADTIKDSIKEIDNDD